MDRNAIKGSEIFLKKIFYIPLVTDKFTGSCKIP